MGVIMENIKVITTEGDCEGKSVKTIGYFIGTIEQIMTYCEQNHIRPYYSFSEKELQVIDCTNISPKVTVTKDSFGNLNIKRLKR